MENSGNNTQQKKINKQEQVKDNNIKNNVDQKNNKQQGDVNLPSLEMPKGPMTKWSEEQLQDVAEQCKNIISGQQNKINTFEKKKISNLLNDQIEHEYSAKNNSLLDAFIKIITFGFIDRKEDFFNEKKGNYLKSTKANLEMQNDKIKKSMQPFIDKYREIQMETNRRQEEKKREKEESILKQEEEQKSLNSALEKIKKLKKNNFEEEITDESIRSILTTDELLQYRKYQESLSEQEKQKIVKEMNYLEEQIKFEEKKAKIEEKREKLEQIKQGRANKSESNKITPLLGSEKIEQQEKKQQSNFMKKFAKQNGFGDLLSLKDINNTKSTSRTGI